MPLVSNILHNSNLTKSTLFDVKNGVASIRLNRPKQLNALNTEMILDIRSKLEEWSHDPLINLVYIKGEGGKAFCSGGDVKAVTQNALNGDTKFGETFFHEEYKLNYLIGTYKKPYIALIDGITMGGGVGVSLHGKYRIATEKTLFAMPETAIGLFPDVGGSYFLPQLPHNLGLFLGLTGQRLKGYDNIKAHIATHFISSDKILEFENELFSGEIKGSTNFETFAQKYQDKNWLKPNLMTEKNMEIIDKAFDPKAFGNGHNFDQFHRHLGQIKNVQDILGINGHELILPTNTTLKKLSPTSLKLTFKLLCESKHQKWDLSACLIHEYRLAARLLKMNDFLEGVRAALVDRDNNPKWNPDTLERVKDAAICKMFEPFTPQDNVKELNL